MTKPKMFQVSALMPDLERALRERVDLISTRDFPSEAQFFEQEGSNIELLVTHAGKGVPPSVINRLPALKLILSWGVGYDRIDLGLTGQKGIRVCNTPEVLNACVADMAMAMILVQSRRLLEIADWMKSGAWEQRKMPPLSRRVTGARLGILGLGRIGLEVARRAESFSMEIRYHNRKPKPDLTYQYEPDLIELARWSDFLLILCPGGSETFHLVDEKVMRALGPDSVLVNIARGSVVDEEAMTQLLLQGDLGGAALDVYQNEPGFPKTLLDLPQVVMFPHIASSTRETRAAMSQLLIDNLDRYLEEGELITPVSP